MTDIGPIDPLTTIVCLRIDGSKFDSLIPVELEGAQKVREVYHQLHNIMPADVSAVDESVDSELEALLDADVHAKASQETPASDSDKETKDGAVSDDSDSVPSLIERVGDSSDENDTDEEVDVEMQPDDGDVAVVADDTATDDGDDKMVDSIVSAEGISSVSVSTDNSRASREYQAQLEKMKGRFNPRKVKLIIIQILSSDVSLIL